jgi:hypothetical protein
VSDISPVHALTKLTSLDCSASFVDRGKLSARALVPLRGLPLTNLCANDSLALSDLSALKEMKLTSLNLRQANVGDADLKNLAGMKDLKALSLWQTKVTDAGLKVLAGLKNLEVLNLQATGVTDVGLKELTGLDKLVGLDLYAVPKVTDAGLEQLAKLKALKEVDLRGTSVTEAAIDKLAAALPSLRIVASSRVIEPRAVATSAWTILKAAEMKSDGGATLKLEKDLSVLVSGNHPDTDAYTLTFRELPGKIHSLRLEALPHESLPNKGPGRHQNAAAHFGLTTIKAELEQPKGPPLVLKFGNAWGDFEEPGGHPKLAIDAEDGSAWSPAGHGQTHYAVFELEQPVAVNEGAVLRVTLEFKSPTQNGHLLGCFRVSAAKEKVNPPSDTDRPAAEKVLSLSGTVKVNDQANEIKAAAELPSEPFRLTFVSLRENKQVTDADLAHLKDCKNLKGLIVSFTEVGDAGLAHFKDCTTLTDLELRYTKMTDAGLANFKNCKNLSYLNLTATNVSDAGLAHIKDCTSLKSISLDGTRVTDAGLAHLKDCKNLVEFIAPALPIGDAGLAHLKDCKNLINVYLNDTNVSDVTLAQLQDCKNLALVKVQKTKVTAAGIDKLKKAFPECKIEWDGGAVNSTWTALKAIKTRSECLLALLGMRDFAGLIHPILDFELQHEKRDKK